MWVKWGVVRIVTAAFQRVKAILKETQTLTYFFRKVLVFSEYVTHKVLCCYELNFSIVSVTNYS